MINIYVVDGQIGVESQKHLISKYSPHKILYSDHCSFQQEYISPRTLSFTGERTTGVAVRRKNNITHSYTIQPITSGDGRLLEKFLFLLEGKENVFGRIVQKNMITRDEDISY